MFVCLFSAKSKMISQPLGQPLLIVWVVHRSEKHPTAATWLPSPGTPCQKIRPLLRGITQGKGEHCGELGVEPGQRIKGGREHCLDMRSLATCSGGSDFISISKLLPSALLVSKRYVTGTILPERPPQPALPTLFTVIFKLGGFLQTPSPPASLKDAANDSDQRIGPIWT